MDRKFATRVHKTSLINAMIRYKIYHDAKLLQSHFTEF